MHDVNGVPFTCNFGPRTSRFGSDSPRVVARGPVVAGSWSMTRLTRLGTVALAAFLTACAVPGNPGAAPGPAGEVSDRPATPTTSRPSATASAGDTLGSPAAPGEVRGQGTVLQVGGAPPQLCLGGVAESYPPQCGGPEVVNWDWATTQQWESASGVTWGAYAVTGTWDGTVFTSTRAPVPLSLHDAMPFEDPLEGRQGTTDVVELERIQREIFTADNPDLPLTGGVDRGFVSIMVVYDDGSIQERMDAMYGPDVVVVQSALRPPT